MQNSTADFYRREAERLRRLARSTHLHDVAEQLLALATQYDNMAIQSDGLAGDDQTRNEDDETRGPSRAGVKPGQRDSNGDNPAD